MSLPARQDQAPAGPLDRGILYLLILGALFVGALVLRLIFIHWSRFAGDESMFYGEASAIVNLGWRPVMCANVSGGAARLPGGTFSYLMSAPLWIFRSPLAVMVWVVLLNLGAYALWTDAVRRNAGRLVSLIFAALLLFNPWSFLYSDRIWNPNLMVLLSGLLIWATVRVVERPPSWQVLWIPLAVLAGPQFHMSGVLLGVLAVVLWLACRPKPMNKKALALGFGIGLALYIPYLASEIGTGFHNSQALLALPSDSTFQWSRFYSPLLNQILMAGGEVGYLVNKGYWFPHDAWRFYTELGGWGQLVMVLGRGLLGWLLALVSMLAVVTVLLTWTGWFVALIRRGRNAWGWLVADPLRLGFLVAVLLPTLFMTVGRKSYHPHYAMVLYPFGFLPLAWAGQALVRRLGLVRGLLPLGLGLFVLCLVWIGASVGLYAHGERRFSYPEHRSVMEIIEAEAGPKPFALELRHRASRHSTSSFHELARHDTKRPFREDMRADLRFTWFDLDDGQRILDLPKPRVAGRPVLKHWILDGSVLVMSRRSR